MNAIMIQLEPGGPWIYHQPQEFKPKDHRVLKTLAVGLMVFGVTSLAAIGVLS